MQSDSAVKRAMVKFAEAHSIQCNDARGQPHRQLRRPFDKEMGYRVVDALKDVAAGHGASPARVAIAWLLGRRAVSSVIIAAPES